MELQPYFLSRQEQYLFQTIFHLFNIAIQQKVFSNYKKKKILQKLLVASDQHQNKVISFFLY